VKKMTGFLLGYLCLVLFSACVQKEQPTGPDINTNTQDVGEAELLLPALPAGFLAKYSADTVRVSFILTISGSGMIPRRQVWPLTSTGGPVKVTGIPIGSRLFKGELDVEGQIAYADSQWARIEKGKTAMVHLKLTSSTGDALLCVEIEGFPLPVGCPPKVPNVAGCWAFNFRGNDSIHRSGVLRITQQDSLLGGQVKWADGRLEDSRGKVSRQGAVIFDVSSIVSWAFTGRVDTLKNILQGQLSILQRGDPYVWAFITAMRVDCNPVDGLDSLTCWDVGQNLDDSTSNGRLLLKNKNTNLRGIFQWIGFAGMPVHGFRAPVNGNTGLYLFGALPEGLSRNPPGVPDSVHYKGQVTARSGYIQFGAIYTVDSTGIGTSGQRGQWKGTMVRCTPDDLKDMDGL
jgi:hypothetical protein